MAENEAHYLAAGMNGVVNKPVRIQQLVSAIDAVLPEPVHALRSSDLPRPPSPTAQAKETSGERATTQPESDALEGLLKELDSLEVGGR